MSNILDKYTADVLRTESKIDGVKFNFTFLMSSLTLAVCAGEILDQIKKHIYYGNDVNKDKVAENVHYMVASLEGVVKQLHKLDDKEDINIDPRTFHAILGVATESTELLQAINFDDEMDTVNILEELGDLMWYNSILVDSNNGNWEAILDTNINKLKARYPDKFTSDNAIRRNLNNERDILEDGLDTK